MEESQKICNPLISVVIPVYNRQKVIGRLLEALEQQTYSNIEIVCVDDGSKDETQHIVQKHMDKDARIILKIKENGGAVSAVCMTGTGGIWDNSKMDPNMKNRMAWDKIE